MRKSRRTRQTRRPPAMPPLQRIDQGEGGERALQDWLDRSRLAYVFLDQSPATMPETHRTSIKRPDFLVAIDGFGTVAVDAKAKAFIEGSFVLDESERRRLDGFESLFGIPVWYACFPPGDPLAYVFHNRDLFGAAIFHDPVKQTVRAPARVGLAVNPARTSFSCALCARLDGAAPALSLSEPGTTPIPPASYPPCTGRSRAETCSPYVSPAIQYLERKDSYTRG